VLPKSSPTGGQIDLGGDESDESLIQSEVQQNTTGQNSTSNKTKEFLEKNDDIQRKIDMLQTQIAQEEKQSLNINKQLMQAKTTGTTNATGSSNITFYEVKKNIENGSLSTQNYTSRDVTAQILAQLNSSMTINSHSNLQSSNKASSYSKADHKYPQS